MSDLKLKKLNVISLLLLNYAIYLVATTPPATGYELSIYCAYPSSLFIFLIVSYLFSIWIILHSIYIRKIEVSCLLSIFVIFLVNTVLILLPMIRGYAFYERHDALTHIGMIKDILNSGYIGNNNFYPILHIESGIILQITNIDVLPLKELMIFIFFILYIMSIYLLVSIITKNRIVSLVSFLFASIPLLGGRLIAFTPSDTFFFIIPFFIFVFYFGIEKPSVESRILLIILLLFAPYTHPEVVVSLLMFFLIFGILHYFSNITYVSENTNLSTINYILIIFTSFFIWFMQFSVFFTYGRRLLSSFIQETLNPPINHITTLISKSQISTYDFLELLMRKEGGDLVYIMLALIISFTIVKSVVSSKKVKSDQF